MSNEQSQPIRLDIGCGKNKKPGFTGVDSIAFDGVDVVCDVRGKWQWEDSSVDEVHCSHFLEHLEQVERVHFYNELYRVLKPGAKATIVVPHWASNRAYGDPSHKWPAVSEMSFYYLSKDWRAVNAPHTDSANVDWGFLCDFDATWGYSLHGDLLVRSQEYQQHALQWWKESAQDLIATLTAKKPA